MTREEAAIKSCEDRIKHLKSAPTHHYGKRQRERAIELEKVKIKALRPVSREQVEKVWRGEIQEIKNYRVYSGKCQHCGLYIGSWAINRPYPYIFCPYCGEAFTDEAVEMVMERLEEVFQ